MVARDCVCGYTYSTMKIITKHDVPDWYAGPNDLASSLKSIGMQSEELSLPEMPYHLQVAISVLAKADPSATVPIERFSSISFFSLCKRVFLPLSGLADQRATEIFGFACKSRSIASTRASTQLIETFLDTDVDMEGPRPASVYKVFVILQDEPVRPTKPIRRMQWMNFT